MYEQASWKPLSTSVARNRTARLHFVSRKQSEVSQNCAADPRRQCLCLTRSSRSRRLNACEAVASDFSASQAKPHGTTFARSDDGRDTQTTLQQKSRLDATCPARAARSTAGPAALARTLRPECAGRSGLEQWRMPAERGQRSQSKMQGQRVRRGGARQVRRDIPA